MDIENVIQHIEFLSIITNKFSKFTNFFRSFRGDNEALKVFEVRFYAVDSGFNSTKLSAKVLVSLVPLFLVWNAKLKDG